MNLNFTAQEKNFQQEVQQFLQDKLPKNIAQKTKNSIHLSKDECIEWQKILHKQGWSALNWPVEHGGTGWTQTQKYIFANECAKAGGPDVIPFGLKMVAPVIYTFGNEEQKQRFLPDILASNVWWCQGYSEPGAGSDLASVRTTAVKEGDEYVVNGTKTWTTLGQHADWIFCLVRTGEPSAKNQEAISFLLINMNDPKITVSPIITIDGRHEVNEVHFDNARVPTENLIGVEGKGWTYAKVLLTHERTGIARVAISKDRLVQLKTLAQTSPDGDNKLIDDAIFAQKVAQVELDLLALEYTELRTLSAISTGQAPGPESSILKIVGTQVIQAIDELYVEAAGYYSMPYVPEQFNDDFDGQSIGPDMATNSSLRYFNNRKASIYGGSNEIQTNIISKAVLGL
ncbi:acyl-CoA dehydrogenase family protein [Colwellia sp. Arc7-D]|jgi:alkylation response protein AidB-like acyl-CoA dehydrogenase|uniref:acyl-CoA dehydrogenase family protein n=1 Tax=Colwellia sp. Arc7-D TaxID=2161872 RepID=UPI000D3D8481|nr:acyl-CoA dehydrogenase family protein [Colwellia sp. Arc7-D]AWB57254.1 pimeloyl-CoA dehydrogenase large subunit [Colwellia sp. Arc7-D]|tara:strand:- start:188 stop:1387 length:1200 start_codon:yes stop_codon:yes gene_type:complete